MKFKVGDKVKFLNEKGGGIVSKILNPSMVNVTTADGFDIPVLVTELIRIEEEAPVDSPKHMFREDFDVKVSPPVQASEPEEESSIPLASLAGKGTVADGIYLAFVPHDQKWLISGLIDVFFVNNTNFDILYSIFLEKEEGGFSGYDYGSVNPASMLLIDSIDRDHLSKWSKGIVQVLFHNDGGARVLSPGNTSFKIKSSRFYTENSFKDSAIIDGKSLLISLLPLSSLPAIATSEQPIPEEPVAMKQAEEVEPENIIDKHRTGPHEAVVDLHIGELVEDPGKMENTEMLNIQVNYFTRCLDNAIANHFKKVTFIHGVGTGVLKTAIKEILKDYTNVEFRDASMQQFGYGALDVIIRENSFKDQ